MKLSKILLCAAGIVGLTACSNNPAGSNLVSTKYENPIIYADCPDPSIVKDGDNFYIFGTGGKVFKSYRMGEWEELARISRTEVWGDTASNIWAPDVYKVGDKWNYYYSNSGWGSADPGIGVMVSDSLEGPWEDKGKVFLGSEVGVSNSIDSVVVEDGGKYYMAWGSFQGIFLLELNEDGTQLKNPTTAKDDKILIGGIVGPWNGGTYEGAYIRKYGDYWYFFGSQGTCCDGVNSTYHVKVARSESITGPYVDSNGVDMLGTNRGELVVKSDSKVKGPGHMSLLDDDNGDTWLIYHGYDAMNPGQGRVVFMDKLLWDENGFPYVRSYKASYGKSLTGPKFIYEGE